MRKILPFGYIETIFFPLLRNVSRCVVSAGRFSTKTLEPQKSHDPLLITLWFTKASEMSSQEN